MTLPNMPNVKMKADQPFEVSHPYNTSFGGQDFSIQYFVRQGEDERWYILEQYKGLDEPRICCTGSFEQQADAVNNLLSALQTMDRMRKMQAEQMKGTING